MLSVQFSEQLESDLELRAMLCTARLRRWVNHALRREHLEDQITLRIVDAREGRVLNRSFRGPARDYATNVLTFCYQTSPQICADIILCAPVVAREAVEQGKDLLAHWAHLVVHGVLHAQGYDHETNERDALEMEALEVLLVCSLGYANPY